MNCRNLILQRAIKSEIPKETQFIEVISQPGKNPMGGRPSKDYKLTRYACYLVAQNADQKKKATHS